MPAFAITNTRQSDSDLKAAADEIRSLLEKQEHPIYAEVSPNPFGFISVEISWGDWKHEHARCDYILAQAGYTKLDERTTEENGSDCYSSEHIFFPWKK